MEPALPHLPFTLDHSTQWRRTTSSTMRATPAPA